MMRPYHHFAPGQVPFGSCELDPETIHADGSAAPEPL